MGVETDIDRDAPVVVHLERRISAPPERLWALHTDPAHWPDWQPDIHTASIDGPFAAGSTITWTTEGLDHAVLSTIRAVEGRSSLWGGTVSGITGQHHWVFAADGDGTLVTTEESWSGTPVDADVAGARDMLEESLVRWLDALEATAATADAR